MKTQIIIALGALSLIACSESETPSEADIDAAAAPETQAPVEAAATADDAARDAEIEALTAQFDERIEVLETYADPETEFDQQPPVMAASALNDIAENMAALIEIEAFSERATEYAHTSAALSLLLVRQYTVDDSRALITVHLEESENFRAEWEEASSAND